MLVRLLSPELVDDGIAVNLMDAGCEAGNQLRKRGAFRMLHRAGLKVQDPALDRGGTDIQSDAAHGGPATKKARARRRRALRSRFATCRSAWAPIAEAPRAKRRFRVTSW
jgi:hypothetical protein